MTDLQFDVYPAIDIRGGRVVRLLHGDPKKETIYGDDPLVYAKAHLAAGARWIHLINLDGALGNEDVAAWNALNRIAKTTALIQFGGGVRSLDDISRALDSGATRVILGTVAVEQPALVKSAIGRHGPDKVLVALDERKGLIETRGWTAGTSLTPVDLGKRMKDLGINTVLYTSIDRDGTGLGVDADSIGDLASTTGLQVIAAGGVATIDDITALFGQRNQGVIGAVSGRALYDGRVDLSEAIRVIAELQNGGVELA